MAKVGRPRKQAAAKHPLFRQFNGDVPWLDGCKEYLRTTCLDCPVPLEQCPAENPRLHKGGRPKGTRKMPFSLGKE
ncbi:MAG: hypothetical protein A2137_03550 [Chloroflexi bacterium RBG_16_58_8]|nr:MAG: hypothetical protein A2137_03550 [Chloroflexi bacterium RBG_16_58_8]